jgi:hypothetical protein
MKTNLPFQKAVKIAAFFSKFPEDENSEFNWPIRELISLNLPR